MSDAHDLGGPSSYMALAKGAAVIASDGIAVGKVDEVVGDPAVDIFDGLVIEHRGLLGQRAFVDADHVAEIRDRGVILALDSAQAEQLPPPSSQRQE